jgi:alpha-tubulin suppressor-like RCC1 family protein
MAQVPNVDVEFDGDGVTSILDFDFPYQKQSEIFVSVDGVNVAYTWLAGNTHSVQVLPAPALGTRVRIYRSTLAYVPLHVFAAGVPFLPRYVDENNRQMLYVVQEGIDTSNTAAADAQEAIATADAATLVADQALVNSQTAISTADQAVVTANAAVVTANEADANADQAVVTANEAKAQAAAADGKADDAVEKAEAAVVTANDAKVTAEAIADTADAAFLAAGNAVVTADNALIIAQGIDAKATQALSNSVTAREESAEALATANAIDGKAQTALDDAAAAVVTADDAKATAEAIDGKAQTALDTANTANTTAGRAETKADAAVVTANEAKDASDTNATRIEQVAVIADAVTDAVDLLTPRVETNEVDIAGLLQANTPRVPSKIQSGHSCVVVLVEGQLWSAISNNSVYNNGGGGLGPNGSSGYFGVERFRRVPIPDISPIVDFGIFGYSGWALCANSNLYVWGHNAFGQLGLGHTTQQGVATLSRANVEAVYTSPSNMGFDAAYNKLMVKDKVSGNILAVGYNGNGQLGLGDATNRSTWTVTWDATVRGPVKTVYNLGNGYGAAVILTTDNRMFVTGYNGHGQLGVGGATINTWTEATAAWGGASAIAQITEIGGGFGYTDSATYSQSYMAVLYKGVGVRTCGNNSFGSIGNGTTTSVGVPYNVPLPSPPQSWMVSGGGVGTIHVLCADQNVYTWGYGGSGNTGTGRAAGNEVSPIRVTGFPGPVRALLTNGCDRNVWSYRLPLFAQLVDGTIMSWGTNGFGEGSVGDNVGSISPRRTLYHLLDADGKPLVALKLANLVGATAETGGSTSVLFTERGYVYVTGHNGQQQITNNTSSTEAVPITIVPPWRQRT